MHKKEPILVSVVVLAYNSSDYIIDTLESIKLQTYSNIELIVSDDFSSDNTVTLVNKWVEQNKNRFVRAGMICSSENTGIAPNANRGLDSAKGDWIKYIAGDDILRNDAIESYINYILKNKDAYFIFADINAFSDKVKKIHSINKKFKRTDGFYDMTAKQQYMRLVLFNCGLPAPAAFLYRDSVIKLGGFDEDIPFCEDYPMWIRATKNNNKLYHLSKITVDYRIHDTCATRSGKLLCSSKLVFEKYKSKVVLKYSIWLWLDYYIVLRTGGENRCIEMLRFVSPYYIYCKILKKGYFLNNIRVRS